MFTSLNHEDPAHLSGSWAAKVNNDFDAMILMCVHPVWATASMSPGKQKLFVRCKSSLEDVFSVIDVDSYKGAQHKALQVTAQSCSTETKWEFNSLANQGIILHSRAYQTQCLADWILIAWRHFLLQIIMCDFPYIGEAVCVELFSHTAVHVFSL